MEHFERGLVNKTIACMLCCAKFTTCLMFIISLACIKETVSLPLGDDENSHSYMYNTEDGRAKRESYWYYNVTKHNHCPVGSNIDRNRKYYNCTAPYQYHCRLNKNTDYRDGCAIPKNCSEGTEAVLYLVQDNRYEVKCDKCRDGCYNDVVQHSSLGAVKCEKMRYCVYEYMICVKGTSTSDNQCTCDYIKGYKPKNLTLKENCTTECKFEKCPDRHKLNGPPSYECIPEDGYIPKSTTTSGPQRNITDVPTSKSENVTSKEKLTSMPESTSPSTASHGEKTTHFNVLGGAFVGLGGGICWYFGRKKSNSSRNDRNNVCNWCCYTENSNSSRNDRNNVPLDAATTQPVVNGSTATASETLPLVTVTTPLDGTTSSTATASETGQSSSASAPSEYVPERNREWLNEYPDLLRTISDKVHKKIVEDLKPYTFTDKYRTDYDLSAEENDLVRDIDQMKSGFTKTDRNKRIVELASSYGVTVYYRFKSCLPEHLKELVDETEDKIIYGLPKIIEHLNDVTTVVIPDDAVLKCRLSLGEPEANIQWFKGTDRPIASHNPKYEMSYDDEEASLVIRNTEHNDAGNYRIEATYKFNITAKSQGTLVCTLRSQVNVDKHSPSQEHSLAGPSQEPSLEEDIEESSLAGPSQEPLLVESILVASDNNEPTDPLLQRENDNE